MTIFDKFPFGLVSLVIICPWEGIQDIWEYLQRSQRLQLTSQVKNVMKQICRQRREVLNAKNL